MRTTLLLPLAGCAAGPVAAPGPPLPAAPDLAGLEEAFAARLGVYALDTGSGREVAHRADERFPMCSTFKTLGVAAVLDGSGPAHLDDVVRYTGAELLEYAPITERAVATGLTIRELCDASIRYSDNTAANLLLADVGGPERVTAFVRGLGDPVTRLDRTEPELNTAVPGDERDTTSPRAIAGLYRELVLGERLDAADRELLAGWLVGNTTGDAQIRAGLPAGWRVGDKTGSGEYGTGNDVAVIWPPDRAPIVLATLSTQAAPDAVNDPALLAEAARLVVGGLG